MKHKVNDIVKITNTDQFKTILESESIDGIEIYYMTDNTSYSGSQIEGINYSEKQIKSMLVGKSEYIISLIDFDKVIENAKIWNNKYYPKPKVKYWPFPSLNLFPKAFRLWTSRG